MVSQVHDVLQLGPVNFDPGFWEQSIERIDARRIPFTSGNVRDTVSQFTPPIRFGKAYRRELRQAKFVKLFLHANVTQIIPDSNRQSIKQVRVQTFAGKRMHISARYFVLACGGIENARLLLASNEIVPNGIETNMT